jgi:hypothetical protein
MIKGSDYYVSDKEEEFDCEVVDIDSFLLPRLKKLSFVKIDIEGAEYFALKGMEKTLKQFHPVILIEIVPVFLKSFDIDMSYFQDYITNALGYVIYTYEPQEKKLKLVNGPVLEDRNYILIPRSDVSSYNHLIS